MGAAAAATAAAGVSSPYELYNKPLCKAGKRMAGGPPGPIPCGLVTAIASPMAAAAAASAAAADAPATRIKAMPPNNLTLQVHALPHKTPGAAANGPSPLGMSPRPLQQPQQDKNHHQQQQQLPAGPFHLSPAQATAAPLITPRVHVPSRFATEHASKSPHISLMHPTTSAPTNEQARPPPFPMLSGRPGPPKFDLSQPTTAPPSQADVKVAAASCTPRPDAEQQDGYVTAAGAEALAAPVAEHAVPQHTEAAAAAGDHLAAVESAAAATGTSGRVTGAVNAPEKEGCSREPAASRASIEPPEGGGTISHRIVHRTPAAAADAPSTAGDCADGRKAPIASTADAAPHTRPADSTAGVAAMHPATVNPVLGASGGLVAIEGAGSMAAACGTKAEAPPASKPAGIDAVGQQANGNERLLAAAPILAAEGPGSIIPPTTALKTAITHPVTDVVQAAGSCGGGASDCRPTSAAAPHVPGPATTAANDDAAPEDAAAADAFEFAGTSPEHAPLRRLKRRIDVVSRLTSATDRTAPCIAQSGAVPCSEGDSGCREAARPVDHRTANAAPPKGKKRLQSGPPGQPSKPPKQPRQPQPCSLVIVQHATSQPAAAAARAAPIDVDAADPYAFPVLESEDQKAAISCSGGSGPSKAVSGRSISAAFGAAGRSSSANAAAGRSVTRIIGRRIEVYWPEDDEWYSGKAGGSLV